MPNEAQGAVLLNSGYEVLGRILAGEGQIRFTRAALDGGDIPEGIPVESLTQPVKFERDGLIVSTDNTGDGEATVVVQASSIGVEAGFAIKGVMLFVADPAAEGAEVAYSYLLLQADPVWVRPEGDAVSKLVTFEIINVISGASSVVANINPDGLARAADLAAFAGRAVGMTVIPVSIPVSAWVKGESTTPRCAYYADLADSHISLSHVPEGAVETLSLDIAAVCGLSPMVETVEDGILRFYAQDIPKAEITGTCYLLAAGIGGGVGPGGGGGEAYVLPVATPTTLGGVKASESLTVEEGGTAHVYATLAPEQMAQGAETDEMLNEVFGPEAE